jgi:biopolymer transport protein TolQ
VEVLLRTLGLYAFALQEQGAAAADPALTHDILSLVARSSPLSKFVLLVLILFSVASWGVILYKLWALGRAERQSAAFLDVFRKSSKFSEVQAVCKTLTDSPLVGVFQAGYAELNTQLRQAAPGAAAAAPRTTLKSITALDRALIRAATVEVNRLEDRVSFLATTASITPYIGLFGTVWGIMAAFQGIGQTGSANLGIVSQPIAEALIATALGLFAAIPAVYFYNHFTSKVKTYASEMDDFALEFLNISERNFT